MSIKNNENSSSGNQNKMHVRINPKIKGFLVYGLKVIAAALCISAVFLGGYFTHYFSVDKNLRSIDFVLDIYEKYYLKSGDEQNPVHVLVDGLMDAYSDYYTPEEYQAYLAAGQGSRQGIGLGFSNSLTIVNVLGNSPAENAGILPGGKVIAIKTDGSEQFEQISDYSHLSEIMQTDHSGEIKQFQVLKKAYTESYTFYSDDSGSYRYSDSSGSMQFVLSNRNYASVSGEWGYIKFTSFNGLSDGTMGGAGQFKGALDLFKSNKKTPSLLSICAQMEVVTLVF